MHFDLFLFQQPVSLVMRYTIQIRQELVPVLEVPIVKCMAVDTSHIRYDTVGLPIGRGALNDRIMTERCHDTSSIVDPWDSDECDRCAAIQMRYISQPKQ